ncbi:hypothetical protein LCGC14_2384810 [marine sediment metagenome]|uniref:Uncharacterized protein n=1 Tax=marine sediment metagenome TaxID=412755 RepID=A0A0F9BZW2_9ZZZZ
MDKLIATLNTLYRKGELSQDEYHLFLAALSFADKHIDEFKLTYGEACAETLKK